MAETDIKLYSADERLGKMDVDLIDISATLTGDGTSGDIMFINTEIPNCVSVNAGTCLLHSVVAVITDHATDTSGDGANITGSFKLVFTADSTTTGAVSVATGGLTLTRAVLDGTAAIVPISAITDMGYFGLAYKSNIGAVLKAAASTKSLYVWGITDSTNDYNGATITLRIGVIKD